MFRTGCRFLPADSIFTATRAQSIARILHKKALFMSKFLYRLGSWSYRKVWPFLAF